MSHRKKILVVEDRVDQWKMVRMAIEKSMPNTEAVWAGNLEQTIEYLQAQPKGQLPNLILLDLYLPEREDGWQVLEILKHNQSYRLLPVVVFSHSGLSEDVKGSYDLGCSSYLVKGSNAADWINYFTILHAYWWQTAVLPPN